MTEVISKRRKSLITSLLASSILSACLCLVGCGGTSPNQGIGGGSSPNRYPSFGGREVTVSFAVSDAAVESVREVTIEIARIDLTSAKGEVETLNSFYDHDRNRSGRRTITVDLLKYPGASALDIVRDEAIEATEYPEVTLYLNNEPNNDNHVITHQGAKIPLVAEPLTFAGFTLDVSDNNSNWVIEFDLRAALTFDAQLNRYELSSRGLRIVNRATSAMLSGTIDLNTLDAMADCDDPEHGKVLYLYEASQFPIKLEDDQLENNFILNRSMARKVLPLLADQFDPQADVNADVNEQLIPPFTSVAISPLGDYSIAYLPAGRYIAAFNCAADGDDAARYDHFEFDAFSDMLYHLALPASSQLTLNLPPLN